MSSKFNEEISQPNISSAVLCDLDIAAGRTEILKATSWHLLSGDSSRHSLDIEVGIQALILNLGIQANLCEDKKLGFSGVFSRGRV